MTIVINGTGSISGQSNYPAEMRNVLINGNFKVNQLALSGTVTLSAGVYGHDGWKAGSSGCTYTFAASGRDFTLTITAGTLLQIVDTDDVESGTYTASWTGTAQGRLNGGTYGGTGISITGIAAAGTLNIEFGTGTLGQVQLENNTVATTFERRRYGVELAICQRYFSKSYRMTVAPGTNTGMDGGGEDAGFNFSATVSSITYTVRFPVSMRSSTPTITTYDALGQSNAANYITTLSASGSQQNNQSTTVDNISERGFKIYNPLNNPGRVFFHWTASARL